MNAKVFNAAFHAQYPYPPDVLEELAVGDTLEVAGHEVSVVGHDNEFVLKLGDQYFRLGFYYSSYDGYEYDDDFIEVKPVEMRVTKWAAV